MFSRPEQASKFTPDYSLSVIEVFRDATYKLICIEQNLRVLTLAVCEETDHLIGLPSWAADFRNRRDLSSSRFSRSYLTVDPYPKPSIFSLGTRHRSNHPHFHLAPDLRTLYVTGVELDRVSHVFIIKNVYNANGTVQPTPLSKHDGHPDIFSALLALRTSRLCSRFSGHVDMKKYHTKLHSAYERCPLSNNGAGPGPRGFSECYKCLNSIFDAWHIINEPHFSDGIYRSEIWTPWLNVGCVPELVSFFITRDGMLGIGSPSIQVGAELVLLYGSPGAAIVHPVEDGKYLFRGFPYVHGLLDILHYRFRHEDFAFVERTDEYGRNWLEKKELNYVESKDKTHCPPKSEPLEFPEKEYALC